MGMQFDNLDTDVGLKKLNGFLTSRSYIEGVSTSNADYEVFNKLASAPDADKFPNIYRWYVHIASKSGLRAALSKKAPATAAAEPAKKEEEEDDDDDLFGDDDDEEEDEEAKAAAKKRAEEAKAKKDKKKPAERSQVVLEVKPWDENTDLEELADKIKSTEVEGLKWGEGHKKEPVAFGIFKLLVQCIIVDDLVALDDVTEIIEQFEDDVQSVEVASMNKV